MKYLITALHPEAKAFIDTMHLTRIDDLPFATYRNDDTLLVICGCGYTNALMATAALLGHQPPNKGDLLINVGICAAPEHFAIDELLLAHKLTYQKRSAYPDMVVKHPYNECELTTVDTAQEALHVTPVDMEAHAVFSAASRFMQLHQMLFVKVVSDHFEPASVTKTTAHSLIASHIEAIESLIEQQMRLIADEPLFSTEEYALIETVKSRFSVSQQQRLDDALCYFKLHTNSPLPQGFAIPEAWTHKKEQGAALESLIAALHH